MKVNFSNVQGDYKPLPEATYLLNVTDGEIKESGPKAKNPGSEYIKWEFTVAEGEFAGRKLWSQTSLLEQALFALKALLAATGKYTDEQLEAEDLEFEIEDVIGQQVRGVVKQKPKYNGEDGEMDNEIKKFKKVNDDIVESGEGSLLP